MRKLHKRRKRRQAKMALRPKAGGGKFSVRHKSRSGRTGKVRSTQLKENASG